ncbi:MAG: hypothetical protein KDA99_20365, partial [Planctomycetales bacterium]|nr:hypothetical protein [Planctomycetales bacterium]
MQNQTDGQLPGCPKDRCCDTRERRRVTRWTTGTITVKLSMALSMALPLSLAMLQVLVPWTDRVVMGQAEVAGQAEMAGNDDEANVAGGSLRTARLIRVPLPIQGNVDKHVQRMIEQVLSDLPVSDERPILVLEFWQAPSLDKGAADSSEFERALGLARYLTSDRVSQVRTVAYLPQSVFGHAVLPVIACEEIVMSPDAEFGSAGIREATIGEAMRSAYSEIATKRRTIDPLLALAMLDPDLEVLKVTTPAGTRYVLSDDVAKLRDETQVNQLDTVVRQGDYAKFTGTELRIGHGFVSHLVRDRQELAATLEIPLGELELDPSLGAGWKPILIRLDTPITQRVVNRIQRGIEDHLRGGEVNMILLQLDSPGGSPAESIRLAYYLSEIDSSRIRTVAYVEQALGDAALVAFACDQVVAHTEATMGGAGADYFNDEEVTSLTEAARRIATQKSRGWSLIAAMFDERLTVHRFVVRGTPLVGYFCQDELQSQRDPDRWTQGNEVTTLDTALTLQGVQLEQMQVARYTVESLNELQQLYNLDRVPEQVRFSWAYDVFDFLARPQVAGTLLFFAMFALLMELTTPGLGVGGFISAVCFVLFFYSQFLNETAGMLEVLLFLTGVACLLVEGFVLPGFGVFGVGGILVVLASLILASQTFVLPQNEYQMRQIPLSIFPVLAAM